MLGTVDRTKILALVVGVTHYADAAFDLLPSAAKDAARIRDLLVSNGVPDLNIRFFASAAINDECVKPESHRIWHSLIEDISPQVCDLLVVFWSGHGFWQGQRDRRVIFSDTTRRNLLNLDVNSLVQYIRSGECRAKTALVIVDACGEYFRAGLYRGFPAHEFPDPTVRGSSSSGAKPVFTVFSAGLGQFSFAVDSHHPLHPTSQFVSELLDICSNAKVLMQTADEVASILRRRFAQKLYGQIPLFWAEDWDGRDLITPAILLSDALYGGGAKPAASAILQRRTLAWQLTGEHRYLLNVQEALKVTWWRFTDRPKLTVDEKRLHCRSIGRLSRVPSVILLVLVLAGMFPWLALNAYRFAQKVEATPDVANVLTTENSVIRLAATIFLSSSPAYENVHLGMDTRHESAGRRANAAIALFQLGRQQPLIELFGGPSEADGFYDPIARTLSIANAVSPAGTEPQALLDLLEQESLAPRAKQAIILALGDEAVGRSFKCESHLTTLQNLLLDVFEHDNDPGVHAAAMWCLLNKECFRKDPVQRLLNEAHGRLRSAGGNRIRGCKTDRTWFVDTRSGLTMIVLLAEGKACTLGDRYEHLEEGPYYPQETRLVRSFAIAMTELSSEAFKKNTDSEAYRFRAVPLLNLSRDDADEQCRSLTEQSTLPEGSVISMGDRYFEFGPYELPREVQWEYACRAGSLASYSFADKTGANHFILGRYATLYPGPSEEREPMSVMPNDFGLFDMHGGAAEWAREDYSVSYPPDPKRARHGSNEGTLRGGDGRRDQDAATLTTFYRYRRQTNRTVNSSYAIGCRPVRELLPTPAR